MNEVLETVTRPDSTTRAPLRLWPGMLLVGIQWILWMVVPAVIPNSLLVAVAGGMLGGAAVLAWWVFFSRAPWVERLLAPVVMAVGMWLTTLLLHESVATAGMGVLFVLYVVPVVSLALVTWAYATQRWADGPRRVSMVVALLVACLGFTLVRTGGITGETDSDFAWRWSMTPEERLLAESGEALPALPVAEVDVAPVAEWPGFRGPRRDGVVPGVRIATDWEATPPAELWRRPVGPGWSSFAVGGDVFFTQEQRGDEELVSAYRLSTGEPVWSHAEPVRFWESNGGAGPRGTPTLAGGVVYALGATGILNALDAATGQERWSRDVAADSGVPVPGWGFASSPLVVDGRVVVAASGRLVAYDAVTGEPVWLGPNGRGGYSSPHLVTFAGVQQIVLLSGAGAMSLAPDDGAVLWENAWPGGPMVQPAMMAGGDLLVTTAGDAGGYGTRRLSVTRDAANWSVVQHWESNRLKPYFSAFVAHGDHAYGFDGSILACIDLQNGDRVWKGGRYGHGQLMLLPDQDLLVVLTEDGDLALVGASPDGFTEIARRPALDGKTWNHPVLVGGVLLVRNGQEMAAFRLAPGAGS